MTESRHAGLQLSQGDLEILLSDAFGISISIEGWEHLAPWSIFRAHLAESGSGLPKSVIVKCLRKDPNDFRVDPQQVRTERAALEFLEGLGLEIAPRLLASDLKASVLVLEDLDPRIPLRELLLEDIHAATAGLSAFARTLGDLGAATIGHAETYYAKRAALGHVDPRAECERFLQGWSETREYAEGIGVFMSGAAESEMASAHEALADPGVFLAFSNGDSGSNNFLVDGSDGGDGRIIDFEFAGYRHVLSSAACLYVPGPMWITVSDPIASGIEDHFRLALSRSVPEAADDLLFGFGMAAACAGMAIERLHRLPQLDSRPPGDESRLQMVSTLECAAKAAEGHRSLPNLAGWMRHAAAVLRKRWKDADVDLAAFRDYTTRH